MSKPDRKKLFPITTLTLGKPPTRSDLFWTRSHLIAMADALSRPLSPYVYMTTQPEGTKLRCIVADLNRNGDSLWPVDEFTLNRRIAAAKSVLRVLRSRLHTILKEYPK